MFGSLLVFFGFVFLSWDYLVKMRDAVYSDIKIKMMGKNNVADNFSGMDSVIPNYSEESGTISSNNNNTVDYSVYFGVLEIPKIRLKRGFYNVDSKYNNIDQNVTMVQGSTMPDVGGNLILMAHSGNAYVSYFAYLYKLEVGDECYIIYNGQSYHYIITNIYDVEKNGVVNIEANPSKTSLTLITCTKDSDSLQTVYIAEEVG